MNLQTAKKSTGNISVKWLRIQSNEYALRHIWHTYQSKMVSASNHVFCISSQHFHIHQPSLTVEDDSAEKAAIFQTPQTKGGSGMFLTKQHLKTAQMFGVAILATASLASCATYKEEFAGINSRLDQLDTKVQGAAQSAESANQSAQQANQRLDQIESRVQQLEAAPRRTPRG